MAESSEVLIFALITCHNRKRYTVNLISQLTKLQYFNLKIFLYDDGSEDGTSKEIIDQFPNVTVVIGSGTSFWANGMKKIEKVAFAQGRPDFVLLLNDDTYLLMNKFVRFLEHSIENRKNLVGQLSDRFTNEILYGGLEKKGLHPLNYKIKKPLNNEWQPDVFHGNVVLLNYTDYIGVGGIDGHFRHAYADFDLALRLKENGTNFYVFSEEIGYGLRNISKTFDRMGERLMYLRSNKGRPIASQFRFLRRHSNGILVSTIFSVSPFIKALFKKHV